MYGLRDVVTYITGKGLVLNAVNLNNNDRTTCYVILNKFKKSIDLENPDYKVMADLVEEVVTNFKETRYDIGIIISKRYSDINLIEGVPFIDVITDLKTQSLNNLDEAVTYLTDLSVASVATLNNNPQIDIEAEALFQTLIYISVIGINLLNKVLNKPELLKGVELKFGRKSESRATG